MWTMGILLVTDILDDLRNLTNLFGNGNSLIWGGLGWFAVLLYMIFVGYLYIQYIRQYLELKCTKVKCKREEEKIRIKLDREKLNMETKREEYEKRRRKLEKERKRKLENKSRLNEELNMISLKDFKTFFMKRKKVMKDIEELVSDIKDLEKEISNLEEEMGAEIEKCLSICKELQNEVEKCAKKVEEEECTLEKDKEIFKKKRKKRKTACVMMVCILLADGNNMLVTARELKDTLVESFNSSKESQVNEPEKAEMVSENITLWNKEDNIEISLDIDNDLREHTDYNFILEDEQLYKVINEDIEDIIFLADYSQNVIGYEQFLTDCREGNMIEVLPEVNYDREFGLNELLNEIAENLEKPFLEKISRGKIIQTQVEWEQSAPKSMELENIIDKRRQVLGMENSISIRRTIYFRLANDYQRLGKECLIQGKDDTDIYYYYGMSIYCCYCALGYERSDENLYSDEEILNYVKARYKDIIDNVEMENLVEEINSAKKIYLLLNE